MAKIFRVHVKKPIEFMDAVLRAYAGETRLSLEGDLAALGHDPWPGAGRDETAVLKRSTISPRQDFLVVPLGPETVPALLSLMHRIGLRRNVWHLQIEKDGQLCFGAYDCFDQHCVWVQAAFGDDRLASLKERGVVASYAADEA